MRRGHVFDRLRQHEMVFPKFLLHPVGLQAQKNLAYDCSVPRLVGFTKLPALQDKTSQSESWTNSRKPNLSKTTAGHEDCLPRETEPNRPLEVLCRIY